VILGYAPETPNLLADLREALRAEISVVVGVLDVASFEATAVVASWTAARAVAVRARDAGILRNC